MYLGSIKETIVRERETRKSMKEIKILAPYEKEDTQYFSRIGNNANTKGKIKDG